MTRPARRLRALFWFLVGFAGALVAGMVYAGTGAPAGGQDLIGSGVLAGLALVALLRR